MVSYEEYMSVALRKCGGGSENLKQLATVWTNNKEQIRNMSKKEVEERLNCP
jgi:hypothetical protein